MIANNILNTKLSFGTKPNSKANNSFSNLNFDFKTNLNQPPIFTPQIEPFMPIQTSPKSIQKNLVTNFNSCSSLDKFPNFENYNKFQQIKIGYPSDLIPISWYYIWQKLSNDDGAELKLIHASYKQEKKGTLWKFVYMIHDKESKIFYGIISNSEFEIKKQIQTNNLNDIRILFDIDFLTEFSLIDIPLLKEKLLENSPMILNKTNKDDMLKAKAIENEIKKITEITSLLTKPKPKPNALEKIETMTVKFSDNPAINLQEGSSLSSFSNQSLTNLPSLSSGF